MPAARPPSDDLTLPEIVFAAAQEVGPCTESDLLLACWRRRPQRFGLKGYTDAFPCSNTLRSCLCGRKSLFARGVLARNASGRIVAGTRPKGRHECAGTSLANLSLRRGKRTEQTLRRLQDTTAARLDREGRRDAIRFKDLLDLFGVTKLMDESEIDRRVEAVGRALAEADDDAEARAVRHLRDWLLAPEQLGRRWELFRAQARMNGREKAKSA